jgi:predicted  nucleic acid-binding Zn-ribbon protein
MSNRVEELESKVAQLEDAVDGLTEELVETRERLSKLETDEGVDNTRTPERRTPESADAEDAGTAAGSEAEAEPETETGAESDPESADPDADAEDDSDSDGNDIIIA